jgi:uncharacterized integral membrane protein (TIGR00698 family)
MKNIKGLGLCIALSLLSYGLAQLIPVIGAMSLCLLLGVFVRTLVPLSSGWKPGIQFCSRTILAYAIILLGLKLQTSFLEKFDSSILLILIGVVLVSILSSLVLYKFLKIDKETSLLIGIGSGICGSSAIAACSKLVTNDSAKLGTSLGVINFVGLIGLFLFPLIIGLFQLPIMESSLLIGGSLQSMGHVAAAGGIVGVQVLNMAVVIKMGRVFLLLPTVLMLSLFSKKQGGHWIQKIPIYIWGFLATILITNLPMTPPALIQWGGSLGTIFLMLAMVGIGYEINLRGFFIQAPKLILLALMIQALQLAVILPFIL